MWEVGGVTFRESNCNGIITIKDVCSGGLFMIAEPLQSGGHLWCCLMSTLCAVWVVKIECVVLKYWPMEKYTEGKEVNISSPLMQVG